MPENSESPEIKIIIANKHSSIEALKKKAEATKVGEQDFARASQERAKKAEKIGGLTFEEALRKQRELTEKTALTAEEETRLTEVRKIMDSYVEQIKLYGYLEDVDDIINLRATYLRELREKARQNTLTNAEKVEFLNQLVDDIRFSSQLTDSEPPAEQFPARGARAFYLRSRVNLLREQAVGLPTTREVSQESLGILEEAAKSIAKSVEAMQRVADAQETLSRGGYRLELPQDVEDARADVRRILDDIEGSNRDAHDFSISNIVRLLESSLPRIESVSPELALEVKTRLTIHDASELVKQANGWIERDISKTGPGHSIGSAFSEADKRGHAIRKETIEVMFGNKMPGIRTQEAWDLLQRANFFYEELVEEVNRNTLDDLARGKLTENEIERVFEILKGVDFEIGKLKDTDKITNEDVLRGMRRPSDEDRNWVLNNFTEKELGRFYDTTGFELLDTELELGSVPTNYWADSDSERKSAVRNLLITKIIEAENLDTIGRIGEGRFSEEDVRRITTILRKAKYDYRKVNNPLWVSEEDKEFLLTKISSQDLKRLSNIEEPCEARHNADKALQLSEKLAIATLETSVWNRTSLTGNDELAEDIGLKGWRKARAKAGRVRGPKVHEDVIEGIGTSWLRTQRRNKDDVNKPLYAKDVNIGNIREGDWLLYGTVKVNRIHQLRKLLLDRSPRPYVEGNRFAYDLTFLQTVVPYFNTADPPPEGCKIGDKALRVYWAMGVVDMALADPSLGWDAKSLAEFVVALTEEPLSDEQGSFITKKQWDWIAYVVGFDRRLKSLHLHKEFKDFFREARSKIK